MPELPEVETVRTGLSQGLTGRRIGEVVLRRGGLRTAFPLNFQEILQGRAVGPVRRRAKYLLIDLEDGWTWLSHLGMTGRFSLLPNVPEAVAHDHVQLLLQDGGTLIYNDARRFGMMDVAETENLDTHPWLAHLGPEPLEKEFTAAYLQEALSRRSGPVKPALMDATLVVGVGNIYASESLFRAHIHPLTPAKKAAAHAKELHKHIRAVLKDAIASGGSSLRDFVRVGGEAGYFQHKFDVYGREGKPCHACGTEITRIVQAARSTFFCGRCQEL